MKKVVSLLIVLCLVLLAGCSGYSAVRKSGSSGDSSNVTSAIQKKPKVKAGTRKNPIPINTTVLYDGTGTIFDKYKAELTLTQVVRGDEALDMVHKGNMFNSDPPEGKEYLLAKFRIRALESKDDKKIDIDNASFDIVSQSGTKYDDFLAVSGIEPALNEMYAGAEQEGYACFMVDKTDTNPLIVFLERNDGGIWFTTDPNAKLAEGSETYTPQESAQGSQPKADDTKPGTRKNPVTMNATVLYDGMNTIFDKYQVQLTLTQIVRGDEAWNMAQRGNSFNSAPAEGREYLFARFKIKALKSEDDKSIDINSACFDLVSQSGNKYEDFVVVSGVEPGINAMYEGAEQEGYVFFLVDKSDAAPMIVFLERNGGGIWFSTVK